MATLCRTTTPFQVCGRIEPVVVFQQLASALFETALEMVVKGRCNETNATSAGQREMADFYMTYSLLGKLTPVVPAVLLAKLGDRGWRRTQIIVPLLGYMMSRVLLLLVVTLRWPLRVMWVGATLHGLCGGFCAFWIGVMTTVSLASTDQTRSMGMMRVELLYGLAGLLGSVASGHLFTLAGAALDQGVVLICVSLMFCALCLGWAASLLPVSVDDDMMHQVIQTGHRKPSREGDALLQTGHLNPSREGDALLQTGHLNPSREGDALLQTGHLNPSREGDALLQTGHLNPSREGDALLQTGHLNPSREGDALLQTGHLNPSREGDALLQTGHLNPSREGDALLQTGHLNPSREGDALLQTGHLNPSREGDALLQTGHLNPSTEGDALLQTGHLNPGGHNVVNIGLLFAGAILYDAAGAGAMEILVIFQTTPPLNWNASQMGYGNAASYLIFLTSFLGVKLMSRCLPDVKLIIIGMLSFGSGIFFMAFVTKTYMFYLARSLTLFALIPTPTIRSLLCQQVRGSSYGLLLTSLQLSFMFAGLAYTPAYTRIYQSSLDWFPGLVFILSAIISVLAAVPISVVGCRLPLKRRQWSPS